MSPVRFQLGSVYGMSFYFYDSVKQYMFLRMLWGKPPTHGNLSSPFNYVFGMKSIVLLFNWKISYIRLHRSQLKDLQGTCLPSHNHPGFSAHNVYTMNTKF